MTDALRPALDDYTVGPVFARRVALILLVASLAQFVFSALTGMEWASNEPGPLEDLQTVTLFLCSIGFALVAVYARGPARMYMTGLAVLCAVMLLREWEVEPNGPITSYMDSHAFRWHTALATAAIAFGYMALRPRHVPAVLRHIFSIRVWPCLAALGFILVGQIGEELAEIAWLGFFRTFEEIMEFDGYAVLLAFAVACFIIARRGVERAEPGAQ